RRASLRRRLAGGVVERDRSRVHGHDALRQRGRGTLRFRFSRGVSRGNGDRRHGRDAARRSRVQGWTGQPSDAHAWRRNGGGGVRAGRLVHWGNRRLRRGRPRWTAAARLSRRITPHDRSDSGAVSVGRQLRADARDHADRLDAEVGQALEIALDLGLALRLPAGAFGCRFDLQLTLALIRRYALDLDPRADVLVDVVEIVVVGGRKQITAEGAILLVGHVRQRVFAIAGTPDAARYRRGLAIVNLHLGLRFLIGVLGDRHA